jgi:hypothetical protein
VTNWVLPKDTELGYFVRLKDYISQVVGGSSIGKVWRTLGLPYRSPIRVTLNPGGLA